MNRSNYLHVVRDERMGEARFWRCVSTIQVFIIAGLLACVAILLMAGRG